MEQAGTTQQERMAWYRGLFEGSSLPMIICDRRTLRILDANPAMRHACGYSADALLARRLPELTGAAMQRRSVARHQLQRCDGTTVPVLVYPSTFDESDAAISFALLPATSADESDGDRRQIENELHRIQALAGIGTWYWSPATDALVSLSPEAFRVFGFDSSTHMPLDTPRLLARVHPDDRERIVQARDAALAGPDGHYDLRYRVVHPSGEIRHARSVAEVQRDAAGVPSKLIGLVQDETERVRAEAEIRHLAYYDPITGLPNRNLFDQVFNKALTDIGADNGRLALMIVNLVQFREVNFALGHMNGDALLKLVGERIQSQLRDGDFTARVGSRFPVMLRDVGLKEARERANAIRRSLERPFKVAGIPYEIGAHIGIALNPDHGNTYGTLLRRADIALFQATQNGQSLAVYDETIDPHTPERLALIGDFRHAVEQRHIRLYCQPKVDMRSGEVVGAEALVRWEHPTLGTVPPDVFVPLIESTDLIHVLTQHMLTAAVEQYHAWRQEGVDLPLAVNLSTRDVAALNLADQLADLLKAHGAAPDAIGLEVTESSVMRNPNVSIAELGRLSRMGFRLYVDDFGTGYSSLSYLTRLPVNVIKIDHGFTMKMVHDRRVSAIVRSTIQLAHELGMTVVAEGTADRTIWDALMAMDCDEAQGFLIAKPFPAAEFKRWLGNAPYTLPTGPSHTLQ
ncbi:EAL domain-containing protein [Oxalobacteraceae bacterium OM1]|nr:EAL domain-containing protein [Oxalobacteraceae bacterium OM1]